jgi:hypothetical protein
MGCHDRLVYENLESFVVAWYGPPERDATPCDRDIPGPLRTWYELDSRWSANLAGGGWNLDEPRLEDGKMVFWAANHAVWFWAYEPDGSADPEVFHREYQEPWATQGARLSEFLLHVTMFEATQAAKISTPWFEADPEVIEQVLVPLDPVPMQPWSWPCAGLRLYVGDGLVGWASDENDVLVAATRPDRLRYLFDIEGPRWDLLVR